jgi:hypothetical protein
MSNLCWLPKSSIEFKTFYAGTGLIVQRDTDTSSPPSLRRDGPSRDYLKLVSENNHGSYLDRRGGHLVTTATHTQPPMG